MYLFPGRLTLYWRLGSDCALISLRLDADTKTLLLWSLPLGEQAHEAHCGVEDRPAIGEA